MPRQQSRRGGKAGKAGRADGQTAVKDRPRPQQADTPRPQQAATPQTRTAASSAPLITQSITRPLVTESVTWGTVNTYSVDSERLMIKLNAGAINHLLIKLPADSPIFRSAVSMTMLAYHTSAKLTIRYTKPPVSQRASGVDVLTAQEIAIGEDPGEALNFDDWPIDI